jgi:hypothetical protein
MFVYHNVRTFTAGDRTFSDDTSTAIRESVKCVTEDCAKVMSV